MGCGSSSSGPQPVTSANDAPPKYQQSGEPVSSQPAAALSEQAPETTKPTTRSPPAPEASSSKPQEQTAAMSQPASNKTAAKPSQPAAAGDLWSAKLDATMTALTAKPAAQQPAQITVPQKLAHITGIGRGPTSVMCSFLDISELALLAGACKSLNAACSDDNILKAWKAPGLEALVELFPKQCTSEIQRCRLSFEISRNWLQAKATTVFRNYSMVWNIEDIAIDSANNLAFTARQDGFVHIHDIGPSGIKAAAATKKYEAPQLGILKWNKPEDSYSSCDAVAFEHTKDGTRVYGADGDGRVLVWNADKKKLDAQRSLNEFELEEYERTRPDAIDVKRGRVVCHSRATPMLFDLETGKRLLVLAEVESTISRMCVDLANNAVVTGDHAGGVSVFDTRSQLRTHWMRGVYDDGNFNKWVAGLDIALSRSLIASCAQKSTHVWDTRKFSFSCPVSQKPPVPSYSVDAKVPKYSADKAAAFGALYTIECQCAQQVAIMGDALVVGEDWVPGSFYSLKTGKQTAKNIESLKKCYALFACADRLITVESSFNSGHNYKSFTVLDFAPKRLRPE